ncbi:hypothetical protein LEN26_008698 [Aphanomyces euteiches]|nr:hypothetical protein AeMF1_014242 [Aphanomyces euteiches]KAH9130266.1 hypothetical protein LEN26_008698 [Aphanomyces euteiches]KAH9167900.1 hypothetical protein AeNC1_018034 [Aphanomyces euteiches]
MWNEILDTLLAYVASYTSQEDLNVGTSSSHDDSTANDDIAMSAADEHAFLVAAKLLDEEKEENTDEEKEDKDRPVNNCGEDDDGMTAFEELAFLAAAKLLNEEDDEGHPTNDWSNQDNDMTASEEEEFLIAAKLLKKTEEHAFIVAAESLEEQPMQESPSRKRVRDEIETVGAKRRRLQFQSVTVYSFPDDLGGSSLSNDGFSIGMKLKHCSQETFDLSKIIDDPEGDRKEKTNPELTPNDRMENLRPVVRYVRLKERLNRLARAGVTAAELEAHRNEVEMIRGYDDMVKKNGLTKQHVQAILKKVKRVEEWLKKRDSLTPSKHIKSNDACFKSREAAENGDNSKKRSAMAIPGKSILKRRKIEVHSLPSIYL